MMVCFFCKWNYINYLYYITCNTYINYFIYKGCLFILLISLIFIIGFSRYDGISCTLWLGAEASMAVSMHLITARSRTGMLVHWVSVQSSLCCQTNSQGFCLSITLVDLKLWIFLWYRTTGASMMCMAHLRTIRWNN